MAASLMRSKNNAKIFFKQLQHVNKCVLQKKQTTRFFQTSSSLTSEHIFKDERTFWHYVNPKKDLKTGDETPVTEIEIPNRIERSPTAILEALASTVKGNVNKPLYYEIDDPILSCGSKLMERRKCLMSYVNGKQAAKHIIEKHADLFTPMWESDPLRESLQDKPIGYIYNEPGEEALLERVEKRCTVDAMAIYKACDPSSITQATLEQFLQLVCVYNGEDPDLSSDLEVYVFNENAEKAELFKKTETWSSNNMATEIFLALPEKTPFAYNQIIRGAATYLGKDCAYHYYNEAKENGIKLDVQTYNSLLAMAFFDNDDDDVVDSINSTIKDMNEANVFPDINTFYSIMSNCHWHHGNSNLFSNLLDELKACGFEPTLSMYRNCLHNSSFKKKGYSYLINYILDEIENKQLEETQPLDFFFFSECMITISKQLSDSKLAMRLYQIVMSNNNIRFLGNASLKYTFFDFFFNCICLFESPETVMEVYRKVVPHVSVLGSRVYYSILKNIEFHEELQYLPELYEDMHHTFFQNNENEKPFLKVLSSAKMEPEVQSHLCSIASLMVSRIDNALAYESDRFGLDANSVGMLMKVFLYGDLIEEAKDLFDKYKTHIEPTLRKHVTTSVEFPDEPLRMLASKLIEEKDLFGVKNVLAYMSTATNAKLDQIISQVVEEFSLSEDEKQKLINQLDLSQGKRSSHRQ